jgi:Family of unknown function (DUF6582)
MQRRSRFVELLFRSGIIRSICRELNERDPNARDVDASRETSAAYGAERFAGHRFCPFPEQRKEPLTDARRVRNAVARFDQVIGVSDADGVVAFVNIEKAAKYYNVNLSETSWHDLGVHPQ